MTQKQADYILGIWISLGVILGIVDIWTDFIPPKIFMKLVGTFGIGLLFYYVLIIGEIIPTKD